MKHVMFADSLGLDLELIHEIKINSIENLQQSYAKSKRSSTDKILIQNFRLNPDVNYKKLVENGICLNSIEIFNQTSIRGIILTLNEIDNYEQIKPKKNFFNILFKNKRDEIIVREKELDVVYVIWSVDNWKTWKYQSTLQKNSKLLKSSNNTQIKTHEFFIHGINDLIDISEQFQFIICHQIGMEVLRDTNFEQCFSFKCAIQL
ncbi:unnamed protein product [Brachionus calyciflorus]|uniref:Uncharacterized protein n=1 Tax=Brachionus calyciflorus TaxID=104777 RepID=A0A813PF38_9BILA|nr:unnamed protein product [Brachionus calyciflorus]